MTLVVALKRDGKPIKKRDVKKHWSTLGRELMGLESPVQLQPRRRTSVVTPTAAAIDAVGVETYEDDCYSFSSDSDDSLCSFFDDDDNTESTTTDESIFSGDSGNVLLNFDDLDLTVRSLACGNCVGGIKDLQENNWVGYPV
jgi:hypothetical protein